MGPQKNRDYQILPKSDNEEDYVVRFMQGPYSGLEYQYETVSLQEDAVNDRLVITHTGNIVSNKHNIPIQDDFHMFTSEVLHDIMQNSISGLPIEFKEQHGFSVRDPNSQAPSER